MKNVNVNYSDDKYNCNLCGKELTKIKEGAMRWVSAITKIEDGCVDSDVDIDWGVTPQEVEYSCVNCDAHLGEDMDENLAEDMLKHNAGVEIDDGLIGEDDGNTDIPTGVKLYALVSDQGTACQETCLCEECFILHNKMHALSQAGEDVSGPWKDVITNDYCHCIVCGAGELISNKEE